jgi:hypothetical protein
VRNPGSVSVWINSRKNNQETNIDVINTELARANWVRNISAFNKGSGSIEVDFEHPLLKISSHVISAQRSSKKRMTSLFDNLRTANGWLVEIVEPIKKYSSAKEKRAKRNILEERINSILQAREINVTEYLELAIKVDKGSELLKEEKWAYERARLSLTYNCNVDRNLILLDDNGNFLKKLLLYRSVSSFNWNVDYFVHDLISKKKPLTRVNSTFALSILFQFCGIIKSNKIDTSVTINQLGLSNFVDFCKRNRIVIEEILKIEMRDDFIRNPIRQLNQFLGLVGLKMIEKSRTKSKGVNLRFYELDKSAIDTMEKYANHYQSFDDLKNSLSG